MRTALLALLALAPLMAQTAPDAGATYFAAAGASAGHQNLLWASFGIRLAVAGEIYQTSTFDLGVHRNDFRTGFVDVLKRSGPWALAAIVDGGLTTGPVNSTFSGGGLVMYQTPWPNVQALAGIKAVTVGGLVKYQALAGAVLNFH
jgi:hypothetical protein